MLTIRAPKITSKESHWSRLLTTKLNFNQKVSELFLNESLGHNEPEPNSQDNEIKKMIFKPLMSVIVFELAVRSQSIFKGRQPASSLYDFLLLYCWLIHNLILIQNN
jgi:hypothetical protein